MMYVQESNAVSQFHLLCRVNDIDMIFIVLVIYLLNMWWGYLNLGEVAWEEKNSMPSQTAMSKSNLKRLQVQ